MASPYDTEAYDSLPIIRNGPYWVDDAWAVDDAVDFDALRPGSDRGDQFDSTHPGEEFKRPFTKIDAPGKVLCKNQDCYTAQSRDGPATVSDSAIENHQRSGNGTTTTPAAPAGGDDKLRIIICPTTAFIPPGRQPAKVLKCGVDGCTTTSLFDRKYDLERHMKTKHSIGAYFCSVPGCARGAGGKPLSRNDKLQEHMRKMHHA